MFLRLFAMLGLVDQGHRRAAVAARERFGTDHPGDPVAWTEIADTEPDRFVVGVYHGLQRPKKCQLYAVDRKTFTPSEILDSPHEAQT